MRKGECNCEEFLSNSYLSGVAQITDQTFILSGYGRVPFATPVDNGSVLQGELWLCFPEDFQYVQALELGAGYDEQKMTARIWDEDVEVTIFTYEFVGDNKVEGDVVEWPRYGK